MATKPASSKPKPMEWTEDHDLLLMREMMVSDLFLYKKGSPNRGVVWDSIVENLNRIENPVFGLKDKRSVRDRWNLLKTKHKKKTRDEEAASGIDVDDLTERESMIEELCAKEDSFVDVDTARKQKERENAEDVRMKALERMGETRKRGTTEDEDSRPKKTRRGSSELIEYLKQKSSTDSELREQQLEMMRMMQDQHKKMMESQALVLQQQQQMSMAFLSTMQKFMEKL
ncbi:uncharacterized protein LOC114530762 [Dendronephthya gigantea]|uniref:uncharacterized protein LOC114530762 n=1 Tax=Dendronephthya gigantea TaxID=151771 RepID=UPI00106B6BDF|nr:uncharacterized protein LOC114530762 [Dendronephthya gigantea]